MLISFARPSTGMATTNKRRCGPNAGPSSHTHETASPHVPHRWPRNCRAPPPLSDTCTRRALSLTRCVEACCGSVCAEGEEVKRYKTAIDAAADEFLCPITRELPLEPVAAEVHT